MNILADENIPFIETAFGHAGTMTTKPGREITKEDCKHIDILLVRSVTLINAALLKDSPIRFVGSATTGHDHMDTAFLDKAGITWATAAGCNTHAVVDYIVSTLAAMWINHFSTKDNLRAAVIGAGRIGSAVALCLNQLGFTVLLVDPFRKDLTTVDLHAVENVDLISLHTPLTVEGPHPTRHMINDRFLQRQKPGCILINTGRGATLCTEALTHYRRTLLWCLDVFEHEPYPDSSILNEALIATPHIAGYSIQAKQRGAVMLYEAALKAGILAKPVTFPPLPRTSLSFEDKHMTWHEAVLRAFDPRITSHQMKTTLKKYPDRFDHLRKHFTARHEFAFTDLKRVALTPKDALFLQHCGFTLIP